MSLAASFAPLRIADLPRRNDIVHSHMRNMSMPNIIPKSRPGISPKIRTHDDEDDDRASPKSDLVKERSSLADMLYLRCQ